MTAISGNGHVSQIYCIKYAFLHLEMIIKYFELKFLLFWLESIIFSVLEMS